MDYHDWRRPDRGRSVFWIQIGASVLAQALGLFSLQALRPARDVPSCSGQSSKPLVVSKFSGYSFNDGGFQGHVTNISGRANRVLRVEIPKPLTHATLLHLHNDYGARREQFLNPFENTNISAVFFVQPVVARAGEKWTSTLIFIDQYNNRHKVKNCVFRGLAPPPQETNAPAH